MKEFKSRTNAGKIKVRGIFKTTLFAFNVGIAINFGRILRYLSKLGILTINLTKNIAVCDIFSKLFERIKFNIVNFAINRIILNYFLIIRFSATSSSGGF